jgi:hypothetical protein
MRAVLLGVLGVLASHVGCSSKDTSGGPSTPADDLTCLATLPTYCCERTSTSTPCDPTWENAELCTSWPAGTPLTFYKSPCQGLRAIRVTAATYSRFYVYEAATSSLVAVADNSAEDPGSTDIACGAGPVGFAIPTDCSAAWLSKVGAEPCDPTMGTPRATHNYCRDQYYDSGAN